MPDGRRVETLGVVAELAGQLAVAGVRYCHWKSNEAIERSLRGDNDLDLLIDRAHASKFRHVMASLGAVPVRPVRSPHVLGLEDHYLRDQVTGRVVHVQPHFELIVGDDMTKSFRLPVEQAFLTDTRDAGLPLPPPEVEYLVFVIRMVVKHCPAEALVARKGRLTESERRELAWLESRIDSALVLDLRELLFPQIGDDLWRDGRRVINSDSTLVQRARVGRRLVRALGSDARRAPLTDTWLKVIRRLIRTLTPSNFVAGKTLLTGGLIVGVVGGDGSGKSTLVGGLVERLSEHVEVERIHLGKPPRSLLTRAVTRPLRQLRERGRFAATRAPSWTEFERHPGPVFALWHWLIARDRLRHYRRARRAAGRGRLVISDRFPLASLSTMDGPRLQQLPKEGTGRLAMRLGRSEAAMYRRIRPPDLLLVVKVPPDIAVERRREQDGDYVTRRAQEVWDTDWAQLGATVLDGRRSVEEVSEDGLRAVWARM
jgi:thymidylate kinase